MPSAPTALVISDFPIISVTARAVFEARFDVTTCTWQESAGTSAHGFDLIVLDITTVTLETALGRAHAIASRADVVVCSLHRNEVEVYRPDVAAVQIPQTLPSLLAVPASR
jgi:hypothetical protein